MRVLSAAAAVEGGRASPTLDFVVLDAKLTPPPARVGTLLRTELLERVRTAEVPVVSVAAPAGYGKSTLLQQWAEAEKHRVAWLSLDATDDDQTLLLAYIAAALDRVQPIDATVFESLTKPVGRVQSSALMQLVASMWAMSSPVVLMIDDADQLQDPDCLDTIGWLSEHLPPHVRLAVASRGSPPLPLARLRARGHLLEIGAQDLALSHDETARLLAAVGISLPSTSVAELATRTEGWPTGVYVATLSLKDGRGSDSDDAVIDGSDRFVADFLRSEILERLSDEDVAFMLGTAPLRRMTGPLCDAALRTRGSAESLARLERSNLFLVPLDHREESYRYHLLFRQFLLAEQRRREPDAVDAVLRRASAWSEDNGEPEMAVEYAHEAADMDEVARLLQRHALRLYRSGRVATLERWFSWFDDPETLEHYVPVALLGGWLWALTGRAAQAERWAAAADRSTRGRADDAADLGMAGWRALLRAALAQHGAEAMLDDARIALASIPRGDPWHGTAAGMLAIAQTMLGTPEADAALARAIDASVESRSIPAATLAYGYRAILAMQHGAWELAEECVHDGMRVITDGHVESYVSSSALYVAAARVGLRRGATEQARRDIASVQRLQPALSVALPWLSVVVRLELARAYLALAEPAGARIALNEAEEVLAIRPGLGTLPEQAAVLRQQATALGGGTPGAATLTTAELRLLAYLPTHLSFREIAERLFVSPNTVKTQAISIYGKLGVSSRSGAIDEAVATGLLDPSVIRLNRDFIPSG